MIARQQRCKQLAQEHGTPLFVVDHEVLRRELRAVQEVPAAGAGLLRGQGQSRSGDRPDALRGGGELRRGLDARVPDRPREHQATCRPRSGRTSSGTRSSTPTRSRPTRRWWSSTSTSRWSPTTTSRRSARSSKHAPHAGLVLRLKVPNTGAMVELSSKFGASPGRGGRPDRGRLRRRAWSVEGLSFHVGSQTHELRELRAGAEPGRRRSSRRRGDRGYRQAEAPRHRRRLPRALRRQRPALPGAGPARSTPSSTGCSPRTSRSSPSRAGSWWPPPATLVAKVIGKAVRDGKRCYYINDGVYHTFSGIIFDHCQYHVQGLQERPDADLLGLRPDLRRPGHDLAGRGTARPGAGRPGLQREHRRLQPRLLDLVQRLPAGQGGARQPVKKDEG